MAVVIDMHVHTVKGGSDSNLDPFDLVKEAKRVGLSGVCLTEHNNVWNRHEFERFAREQDILLFRGMEVSTELGHIIVFGLESYVSGIHKVDLLRKVVDGEGGFAIAVHPFRKKFEPKYYLKTGPKSEDLTVEESARLPIFSHVHSLEVVNGACSFRENLFALQVAEVLGWSGTAGSDAHSTHGLGSGATVFEADIRSEEDLLRELRAGRFYPGHGLPKGLLQRFP